MCIYASLLRYVFLCIRYVHYWYFVRCKSLYLCIYCIEKKGVLFCVWVWRTNGEIIWEGHARQGATKAHRDYGYCSFSSSHGDFCLCSVDASRRNTPALPREPRGFQERVRVCTFNYSCEWDLQFTFNLDSKHFRGHKSARPTEVKYNVRVVNGLAHADEWLASAPRIR